MTGHADNDVELQGAEFGLYAKENIANSNGDIVVDKGQLIEIATNEMNLAQMFYGWVPYW